MTFTTWMIRRQFTKNDNIRDAGLVTPDDICRENDICYGADLKWQVLDVYRPKNSVGELPVIVSIHGGGWAYGDKERYQWYCMNLAQRGFAVINFTYRLAPEFKFPAALEDTNLVFQWMMNYPGLDLERVYAVGDSAGAHLLTIYSAICTNEEYAARFSFKTPVLPDGRPFVPQAVGLNCGVYEISLSEGNPLTTKLIKAMLKKKGSREEMELINPIPYINSSFPRAYVMTAYGDPLAGPSAKEGLVARLSECGVAYIDRTYGCKENPLDHVFHCNIRLDAATKCNDEECSWFIDPAD